MKNELTTQPDKPDRSLDQLFADKPILRERMLEVGDLVNRLLAEGCTAHQAEARALEPIRKLGHALLTEWAVQTEAAAVVQAKAKSPQLRPYRKEKIPLTWHTTYGEVSVPEQRLRDGRRGPQVRPFCAQARISARAYSLPLQRAPTDFGADHSFAEAAGKVREHYGRHLAAQRRAAGDAGPRQSQRRRRARRARATGGHPDRGDRRHDAADRGDQDR
jgi:hypothetical protein